MRASSYDLNVSTKRDIPSPAPSCHCRSCDVNAPHCLESRGLVLCSLLAGPRRGRRVPCASRALLQRVTQYPSASLVFASFLRRRRSVICESEAPFLASASLFSRRLGFQVLRRVPVLKHFPLPILKRTESGPRMIRSLEHLRAQMVQRGHPSYSRVLVSSASFYVHASLYSCIHHHNSSIHSTLSIEAYLYIPS